MPIALLDHRPGEILPATPADGTEEAITIVEVTVGRRSAHTHSPRRLSNRHGAGAALIGERMTGVEQGPSEIAVVISVPSHVDIVNTFVHAHHVYVHNIKGHAVKKQINKGRWTTDIDGRTAVVFLIGMRINRLRAVHRWRPVAAAMPRMLRELAQQPELGMLSARTYVSGRDILVVQYWRSVEELNSYARAAEHLHLPAWRAFNSAVKDTGVVGIWHETIKVGPGTFEAIYGNMPAHGLAGALGGAVPVGRVAQSAAARMDRSAADEPALTPY